MSGASTEEQLQAACAEMPIFPLPQVVLFPRAVLPLHIFEPRYRTMLADALGTHKVIAMAFVADPDDLDENGHPRIAPIAGAGIIVEHQPLADGRSNILLHGQARVRLEELPFVPPYRRARATLLEEIPASVADAEKMALVAAASSFAGEVARRNPRFAFRLPPSLDPGAVADLCAHHLVVDARARQAILEELDVAARVRRAIAELASQLSAMTREPGGSLN